MGNLITPTNATAINFMGPTPIFSTALPTFMSIYNSPAAATPVNSTGPTYTVSSLTATFPEFRPVQNRKHGGPNPGYHLGNILSPAPKPPAWSPAPVRVAGLSKSMDVKYKKWVSKDEAATCPAEYNGEVVPRYCSNVPCEQWYFPLFYEHDDHPRVCVHSALRREPAWWFSRS
ncbi:hypothetical protein K458DRAFT_393366 [Lentithecium fluviatile CBS 122367]|uniref:Uncharacterized protein n=1 Tax=Lentithecium fluviatile CBS 122367 TaxID=1168545 RepID=A0A6G1IPB7_9PLEO|nr:hypothetical protein K458DRAFT_393366 [Lentithecium fluviatile CBS 122367]